MRRLLTFMLILCLTTFPIAAIGPVGEGLSSHGTKGIFQTKEARYGATTMKYPVYIGPDETWKQVINEAIEREVDHYFRAIREAEKRCALAGWVTWQEGKTGRPYSLVFVKSLTYRGAPHPMTYLKGLTWDEKGKRLTANDMRKHLPDGTIERLRTEVDRQCKKKKRTLYPHYKIDKFPEEFYIGTDGNVYFIFQEYTIAPYATGWIPISMGRYR